MFITHGKYNILREKQMGPQSPDVLNKTLTVAFIYFFRHDPVIALTLTL